VTGELFKIMAGVDIVHVPYRGIALALNDLLGGRVQVTFASMPSSIQYIRLACRRAAEAAGLSKLVTVHTLRHSFATHLLEQGVDIRVIQDLLGHRHIKSTVGYTRVAIDMIRQVQSPLELLNMAATTPE